MTDSHILGLVRSGALRVVALGVFAALAVAACGGDGSADAADGTGGAGTGGSANGTGGSANGTGGSTNGTGGSVNGTGGNSGGDGGASGGGLGGFAGGGNAEDCPASMPEADSECTVEGFPRPTCTYGDQECSCSFGQDPVWECGTAEGNDEDCPADAPGDGDACTTTGTFCQYTEDSCACFQDEWNCF
jgi:hypothetical protein